MPTRIVFFQGRTDPGPCSVAPIGEAQVGDVVAQCVKFGQFLRDEQGEVIRESYFGVIGQEGINPALNPDQPAFETTISVAGQIQQTYDGSDQGPDGGPDQQWADTWFMAVLERT